MTPEQLNLRDEILQVMFWLRGEGFGKETDAKQLSSFLPDDPETISLVLELLTVDGFVEKNSNGMYSMLPMGVEEGGKRFAEEFADAGINAGGHGTCAPGCDCELHGHEYCDHRQHDHDGAPH